MWRENKEEATSGCFDLFPLSWPWSAASEQQWGVFTWKRGEEEGELHTRFACQKQTSELHRLDQEQQQLLQQLPHRNPPARTHSTGSSSTLTFDAKFLSGKQFHSCSMPFKRSVLRKCRQGKLSFRHALGQCTWEPNYHMWCMRHSVLATSYSLCNCSRCTIPKTPRSSLSSWLTSPTTHTLCNIHAAVTRVKT